MILYLTTLISCNMAFFVSKYVFRDFCAKKVFKKRIFQVMLQESEKKPWQTSILLRVLFFPVAYKNYAMGLMKINFVQYAVPVVVFYVPYLWFYVLVGSSFQDY